jgi:pyridoxal phosphate enzyme (YggS family)
MENILHTCQRNGRNPDEIRLVVVTKTHSVEKIRELLTTGARHIGENYVEEAAAKKMALGDVAGLSWHMIGHIQSRKTTQVTRIFDWVHSVDRYKIARRLSEAAQENQTTLPVLLECNVSGETSKFGYAAWEPEGWPSLAETIAPVFDLPGIKVRGLMTMAPFSIAAEDSRVYFMKLKKLADYLRDVFPASPMDQLSMGMSQDYIVALEEGATLLRIGTAIMGERNRT